jgi:hypothetical protein
LELIVGRARLRIAVAETAGRLRAGGGGDRSWRRVRLAGPDASDVLAARAVLFVPIVVQDADDHAVAAIA